LWPQNSVANVDIHPDNKKTNKKDHIRERTHNAQQHQGLRTTGLDPGAAHQPQIHFFLIRSSLPLIARVRAAAIFGRQSE
jgi:hypothetical protein